MNKRLLSLFRFVFAASLAVPCQAQRSRSPRPLAGDASWAHDGKHIVYQGKWHDVASWEEVEAIPEESKTLTRGRRNSTAAFREAISEARGERVSARALARSRGRSTLPRKLEAKTGTRTSSDGTVSAAVVDGVLWYWKKDGKAKKLAAGLAGVRHFTMAPDGAALYFIKDQNLQLVNAVSGKSMQLTNDGGENIFNGELDWVYQEEVYGRGKFKAAWFGPRGKRLVFMRIDENGVDSFRGVDHMPNQLGIETLKYPKSGRTNPRVQLRVADVENGDVTNVDLSKYAKEDEILIVRVGWTPKGDDIVFMVQNREQTWLDLNFADPKTGKSRTIIHENCEDGWVNRLPMPRWLEDKSFIWESDRTGYRHFYRYDRQGKLLATISRGEWNAGRIITLDEEHGWMGFSGTTYDYALGQNAYYATLDGRVRHQVTRGRGNHTVSFNKAGTHVLDSFNNLENPGEQWLRTIEGVAVRRIYARKPPKGASFATWKQIKARDGETLDITYTLPEDFDENMAYPVWISTYSGPNAPSVRDSYRRPARGRWYIQLQVNVRSASRRGMKFTKKCYMQFGVQELMDIEDAIDWLCAKPWADVSRVGISGRSYGGFMTAFAMTHSKKFKCGIAVSGVYDWELYDTIYTERYMKKPQNNREGYAASSCIKAAKNLEGELLIVHGTMDDNVHMQNAIQFIHALQQAGKQNFTFMLYPKSRHGVRSGHLRTLRQNFMKEHL